jgi:BirA family transcriptional regulator, biotin operon repressor / biotin---[acetyl-CoA-carboxylase] ligase
MNLSFDTQILAKSYEYLPTCHSTSDMMLERIKSSDVAEGHLILTFHQTKGRGQRGNTWDVMPHKNLTFTLYLNPKIALIKQFNLSILVSVALMDALQSFTHKPVKIKWPNDIYVFDDRWKKIGGILVENQIKGTELKSSVVGIGLNINQTEFEMGNAVSLRLLEDREFDLLSVLNKVLVELENNYLAFDEQWGQMKYNYTKSLLYYGEKGKFEDGRGVFEGEVLGVNESGRLLISVENKVERFDIKELRFIV